MNTFFSTVLNNVHAAVLKGTMIFTLCVSSYALPALADNTAPRPNIKQVVAVSIDNDLFVPLGSRDRDFTGGFALTYSEAGRADGWRPVDALLGRMDRTVAGTTIAQSADVTSMELGFYGFTPDAIEKSDIVADDRPYASLIYFSSSRVYSLANGDSISTALTLGVLGSDFPGATQNELHQWLGNQRVKGWDNQISDGGELTARYQIARHHYWNSKLSNARYKTSMFSSVGYLTEVGVALSTRRGLISSPDNRFNPELISYGERVNDTASTSYQGPESYFWGGISLKARLYNAFLQGQFRHSDHTLDYGDLRLIIAEAWLGYTFTVGRQYKVSYVVRAQSSELEGGRGDRSHVWGGLVLSWSR